MGRAAGAAAASTVICHSTSTSLPVIVPVRACSSSVFCGIKRGSRVTNSVPIFSCGTAAASSWLANQSSNSSRMGMEMGVGIGMRLPIFVQTQPARRTCRFKTRASSQKNMTVIILAAALPIALVLITVVMFRIFAEKLDRDFIEEIERKIRLMKRRGIPEEKIYEILKAEGSEEETEALPQSRSRPKREV